MFENMKFKDFFQSTIKYFETVQFKDFFSEVLNASCLKTEL